MDDSKWARLGVPSEEAREWGRFGFGPEDALAWQEAGFPLADAQQWLRTGLTPTESARLREQGAQPSAVINAQVAANRWVEEASDFAEKIGEVPPGVLQSFVNERWFSDDAVEWARSEVPADSAHLWLSMRIPVQQASQLMQEGRSVASVIVDWWQAGIPPAEVSRWIAAGYTASDAAEARASGRSLR